MKSWADKWKVTFEPSECKALTNSRKRNPTRVDLFFGSTKLAEKNELELLGVTVDCKLIWTKHVSSIDARAGQKLGALRKVAHKLTRERRATVYKAQVRCVMECASLCWMSPSSSTMKLFDSIQSKALQIIGVNDQQARSDLNIPLLHHRRLVAAASMLYKMHRSKCPADLKACSINPTCFDVQLDPVCQCRVMHSLYQSQEPTLLIGLSSILQSKLGMNSQTMWLE